MNNSNIYEEIVALCNCNLGGYNPVKYWFVKIKFKKKIQNTLEEVLPLLEQSDQDTMMFLIELFGEIGNKKVLPYIKKCIAHQDLWGRTMLNIGVALIKLEDGEGVSYLKEKIKDINTHRDLRIDSAKTLIHFRKKGVFGHNEHVNVSGKTMTKIWSNKLSKLIDCLRASNLSGDEQ